MMNLSMRYPTWAMALWLLLLHRFNDGTTTATAAAAGAFLSELETSGTPHGQIAGKRQNDLTAKHHRQQPQHKEALLSTRFPSTATTSPATTTTIPAKLLAKKEKSVISSVTRFHLPCPATTKKNAWSQLVPPLLMIKDSNVAAGKTRGSRDVVIEWHVNDDLNHVARSMVESLLLLDGVSSHDQQQEQVLLLVDHLEQCMEEFQSFCLKHLRVVANVEESPIPSGGNGMQHPPPPESSSSLLTTTTPPKSSSLQGCFRARIVATRGPSGTKCPRWHVDHVPVRWIQSLVGPGCDVIECTTATANNDSSRRQCDEQECWNRLQQDLLENDDNDNNALLPSIISSRHSLLQIRQASEQEVALLVGNRWMEFARDDSTFVPPAVHKSPQMNLWQGRVLLTMDVIAPHHHDD